MQCFLASVVAIMLGMTALWPVEAVADVANGVLSRAQTQSLEHQMKVCLRELHRFELDEKIEDGLHEDAAAYRASKNAAVQSYRELRSTMGAVGEWSPAYSNSKSNM